MKIKKFFFSLSEVAEETGINENQLIHLAVQGQIAISVWFKGVVIDIDHNTYQLKVVGYRDELMCLTPYEARSFLTKDTSSVRRLVDECNFEKYRTKPFNLSIDNIGYDGCGKVLAYLETEGVTVPEDNHGFLKEAVIPDIPSTPGFMGYKGIGFRKLLENELGCKTSCLRSAWQPARHN